MGEMEPIQEFEPQPISLGDPSTWDTLPADLGDVILEGEGTPEAAVEEPKPEVKSKEDLDARIKELEYLGCMFNTVSSKAFCHI